MKASKPVTSLKIPDVAILTLSWKRWCGRHHQWAGSFLIEICKFFVRFTTQTTNKPAKVQAEAQWDLNKQRNCSSVSTHVATSQASKLQVDPHSDVLIFMQVQVLRALRLPQFLDAPLPDFISAVASSWTGILNVYTHASATHLSKSSGPELFVVVLHSFWSIRGNSSR